MMTDTTEQDIEDYLLVKFNYDLWDELANLLDPEVTTSSNWRHLAGNLGYSMQDVSAFESRHTPTGSNTMKLLLAHTQKTHFTLSVLRKELVNIERHDAVNVIDEYKKKIKSNEKRHPKRSHPSRDSTESSESGFHECGPTPPLATQNSWGYDQCSCNTRSYNCSSHVPGGRMPMRQHYSVSDNNNRQSPKQYSHSFSRYSGGYCRQQSNPCNYLPVNLKSTDKAISFVQGGTEDDIVFKDEDTSSMDVDPSMSCHDILMSDTNMSIPNGDHNSYVPFEDVLMRTELGDLSFPSSFETSCGSRSLCTCVQPCRRDVVVKNKSADINQNVANPDCLKLEANGGCKTCRYHTLPKRTRIHYESSKTKPQAGVVDRSQSVYNTKIHDFKQKVGRSSIFLHYIVDCEETKNHVGSMAVCSDKNGFPVSADIYDKDIPSANTEQWLKDRFEKADFVIVVISPGFKDYIELDYRNGNQQFDGLHAKQINHLIGQEVRQCQSISRFIPVLLPNTTERHIPSWLKSQHKYLWPNGYKDLFMFLWQPHRNIPSLAGRNVRYPKGN